MQKYVCTVCHYIYDPEVGDPDNGIAPGTAFEDLPSDWVCPLCAVGKDIAAKCKKAKINKGLHIASLFYFFTESNAGKPFLLNHILLNKVFCSLK